MTEIIEIKEGVRYSVNPIAFFLALICAPLLVTLFSFWTVIGLFALPFGIVPYLAIGTPVLLWAVGRIKPRFWTYAFLGLVGNMVLAVVIVLIALPENNGADALDMTLFFVGFGLIFAPLWAGTFGSLYAKLHPNIRILQT